MFQMRDRNKQRMSDNPSSAFVCALQSIVYVKSGRNIVRQINTSYTERLWFGKYRKKQMSAHTCDRRRGFLFHFFPGWKKLHSVSLIGDFKQRERGRRRGPRALRKNPNNHLRMTGGKKFDVLRSAPMWNESLWRWLTTWVFFFAFSAI